MIRKEKQLKILTFNILAIKRFFMEIRVADDDDLDVWGPVVTREAPVNNAALVRPVTMADEPARTEGLVALVAFCQRTKKN